MKTLRIDFESRSAVDLRKTGVYPYAESDTTDIWCMAYAFDDEPVDILTFQPNGAHLVHGRSAQTDVIFNYVAGGGAIHAWNANFEMALWENLLVPREGWPLPKMEQWRCSMAQSLAMSLPGGLDNAASALGVPIRKDAVGYGRMLRLAKPRKVTPDGITWWGSPEDIDTLHRYCKNDVEVEREISKRLLPLRPFEQRLWHIDQEVNRRGVHVDTKLCHAAKKIVKATQEKLDKKMCEVTDWEVRSCSAVGQLTAFCRAHGVDADSVAKDQIDTLLARDDLPDDVRAALELRKLGSRASVAKIDALLVGMSSDGRAKGLLQFHAASTGRWGGRRFQPQNIKRPEEDVDIDEMIDDVMTGDVDLIEMLYGDPLTAVANCLRGMVCAG